MILLKMKTGERKTVRRRLIHSYLSSMISITLVLIVAGVTGLLAVNAGAVTDYFKENIKLSVIFDDSVVDKKIKTVVDDIKEERYVKDAVFISKEQGTEEMKSLLGDDFVSVFGINPVPVSCDIFLKSQYVQADSIAMIKEELVKIEGIREIVYQESLVRIVSDNMKTLIFTTFLITGLLLFVSFVLINNTVRLNLFARRFTIHTMKMVGASHSFIRKPFLANGALMGLLSGVLAVAVLGLMIYYVDDTFGGIFDFVSIPNTALVLAGVIIFGIVICVYSSYRVVNKLLNMSVNEIYY